MHAIRFGTLLVGAVLVTSVASAQEHFVSYPQRTTQPDLGGNSAPFGFDIIPASPQNPNPAQPTFAHSQLIVPEAFLPSAGGTLLGIELVNEGNVSSTVVYQSLRIDVDHLAANALSQTFAQNLTAPTTVLQLTNAPVFYPSQQWARLQFTTPFVYSGSGALVFDVVKEVDASVSNEVFHMAHFTNVRPLAPIVWSPDPVATTAQFEVAAPHMRLVFDDVPTLEIENNGANPATRGFERWYPRGTVVDVTLYGQPGFPYILYTEVSLLAQPLGFLTPFAGEAWVDLTGLYGANIQTSGAFGPMGEGTFTFPIPDLDVLFGLTLGFQALTLDPAFSSPVWTNYASGQIH